MTTPNPNVSAVDALAAHFRNINARLASLERAASTGSGVTDHGALTGLADDDHPQYLLTAEGDARYPLTSALGSLAYLSTVTTAEITNLTIQAGDLAADSVTNAKILDNTIANGKLAQITGPLFKGRDNATLGNVEDLTVAEVKTMLGVGVAGMVLIAIGQAAASSTLSAVTTSPQDIVGCTSGALALKTGDKVLIHGTFDTISASGVTNIGTLDVNGTEQSAQALFKATSATDREVTGQNWVYTVPSDGNYTFKLRGRVSTGTVGSFGTQHSVIVWQVFR